MNTPAESPRLDFAALAFPSDTVNVADLRQRNPYQFDKAMFGLATDWHAPLYDLLKAERDYVLLAYEKAQTGTLPFGITLDTAAGELQQHYIDFGLAKGENHAAELIRHLHAQVCKQTAQVVEPG